MKMYARVQLFISRLSFHAIQFSACRIFVQIVGHEVPARKSYGCILFPCGNFKHSQSMYICKSIHICMHTYIAIGIYNNTCECEIHKTESRDVNQIGCRAILHKPPFVTTHRPTVCNKNHALKFVKAFSSLAPNVRYLGPVYTEERTTL